MAIRRKNVVRFPNLTQVESIANQVRLDAMFTEYFSDFEEHLKREGCSEFTIAHYLDNLRAGAKGIPQTETLAKLTTEKLEFYVFDPMRYKGRATDTINGRIKSFERYYDFLLRKGHVKINIARGLQKVRNRSKGIPSLSNEQARDLLKQPDLGTFTGLRDYTIMKLMLDCGIRLRETMDLKMAQVDLKSRRLKGVFGKNRDTEDIPISKPMCKQLQIYLEERGDIGTDALFVTIDGTALKRRTFEERMSNYGKQAGIQDVRVSPHTLRHTFAKQWILNGGDPFSLQRILRHHTMDMVKRYVYLWTDEVQVQHDKFSPLLTLESGGSQ